jgi:8-oxo-dGTP pyrophosphatase MutT (NUDIX family)
MEITHRTHRLPRELNRILTLVDGKSTLGELLEKSPRLSESKLRDALDKLLKGGFVRQLDTGPVSEFSQNPDFAEKAPILVSELDLQAFFAARAEAEQKTTQPALCKTSGEGPPPEAEDLLGRHQAKRQGEEQAGSGGKAQETEKTAHREIEQQARQAERMQAKAERRGGQETEAGARAEARERARREAEEKARIKAEGKARKKSEALSRAEAEAVRKAVAKAQGVVRAGNRLRTVLSLFTFLIAIPLILLHFVPLNTYLPDVEKAFSDRLHEPVRISSLRVSLLPWPHVKLEDIIIGTQREVTIADAKIVPELTALFSGRKDIRNLEIASVSLERRNLRMFPLLTAPGGAADAFRVRHVTLKNIKLTVNGSALPAFHGELDLGAGGDLKTAWIASADGTIKVDILPRSGKYDLRIAAKKWAIPARTEVLVDELRARATATPEELRVTDLEARLYDGTLTGTARLGWAGEIISLDGDIGLTELDFQPLLALFTQAISATGRLDAKMRYASRGRSLPQLLDNPSVRASFRIRGGSLGNVDLFRAIKASSGEEISGGATEFRELSGTLLLQPGQIQLRQLKLLSGFLSARGSADLSPDRKLSGEIHTELATPRMRLASRFAIAGRLGELTLRRID